MSRHSNIEALSARHDRDFRRFVGREERKIHSLAKNQPNASDRNAENNASLTKYVRYRGVKIMQDEAMAFSIAFSKMKSAVNLVNEMTKMIPAWQLVLGFNVNRMEDVRNLKNALQDVRAEIIAADPDPSQSNSFFDFFERFVRIGQWLLVSSLTSSQGQNELSSFPKRGAFERVWTGLIAALKTLTEFRAYYASDRTDMDRRSDTRTRTEQVTAIDTLLHDMIRESSSTLEMTCENLSRCYTFALEKAYESVMWIGSTLHQTYFDGPVEKYAGPALDDRDAISTAMRHLTLMITSGYQVITQQALQKQGPVIQRYFIVHHRHFQAVLRTLAAATLPEEPTTDTQFIIDALNRGAVTLIKAGVVPDESTGQSVPPSTVGEAKTRYLNLIRVLANGIMYPLSQEFHSLHALATSSFGKAVCRNRFVLSLNAAVVQATNTETAVKFAISLLFDTLGDDISMDVNEVSNAIDYWNDGLGVTQHIMKGSYLPAAVQKSSGVALQKVISGEALPTGHTAMTDIHGLLRRAVALYPATALTSDLSDELAAGIELDASLREDIQNTAQNIAAYVSRDEDTANEIRASDDITDALLMGAPLKELTSLASSLGTGNIVTRLIEGVRRIESMYSARNERELRHLRQLSQFTRNFLNGVLEDMTKKSNVEKAHSLLTEIDVNLGRVPANAADAYTIRSNGTSMVRKFKVSADNAKNIDSRAVFILLSAIAGIETAISDLTFSVEIPLNASSSSNGNLGAPNRNLVSLKLNRTTQLIVHTVMSILLIGLGALLLYNMFGSYASSQETTSASDRGYGTTYNASRVESDTALTTEYFVTDEKTKEISAILNKYGIDRFNEVPTLVDGGEQCRNELVNAVTEFGVDIAEDVVFQPDGKSCGQYIGTLLYGAQDPLSNQLPVDVVDSVNRGWVKTLNLNQTDIGPLISRNTGKIFGETGTVLDLTKLNYEPAIRQTANQRIDQFIYPNANNTLLAESTTIDQTNALLVQMYADGIRFPQEVANISSNLVSSNPGLSARFFNQLAPYGNCRFYRARPGQNVFTPGQLYPVPSPDPATHFPVTSGTRDVLGYLSGETFVPNTPGAYDVATSSLVTGTWLAGFGINSVIYAMFPGYQPTKLEVLPEMSDADAESERRRLEAAPDIQSDLRLRYTAKKFLEGMVAIAPLGMTAGLMAYGHLQPGEVFDSSVLNNTAVIAIGGIQALVTTLTIHHRYFSSPNKK